MIPACLRETAEGVYLSVKLQPRATRNQIQGLQGKELKIAITAPPVDSAANNFLLKFLAEELNLRRSDVQLVRGETSRHKTIFIAGVGAAEFAQRLSL